MKGRNLHSFSFTTIINLNALLKGKIVQNPSVGVLTVTTIGPSTAGKSAFVNAVMLAFGSDIMPADEQPVDPSVERSGTKKIKIYDFFNPAVDVLPHPFRIIDTKGVAFSVKDKDTLKMLSKILEGLPAETDLSKPEGWQYSTPQLATRPHFVLITVNARGLEEKEYDPGYWASWIWSEKWTGRTDDTITDLVSLAKYIETIQTDGSVYILITHMDKVHLTKDEIKKKFYEKQFAPTKLVFAAKEKTCTCEYPCTHWTPETLANYRSLFGSFHAMIKGIVETYSAELYVPK